MTERATASDSAAPQRDGGFALIEIIVAIGIIGVVMTALLPQLVVGLRSSSTARLVSQAKGVAQGEIDHMRNLPWHVAPQNGDTTHKYYDLFDTYFPDLTKPATLTCDSASGFVVPEEAWSGFVGDGDTRCDYEPTGPMYRKVLRRTSPGFMVVVDTQFLPLTGDGSIAPDAGYDTAVKGLDTPYSTRVGVTVNVLYSDRATSHPVSTYTELAQQRQSQTRLEVKVDATALRLTSIDPLDGAVSLDLGALHLRGALANTSTANATLAGASASLATGLQDRGANATVTAPTAPALPDAVEPNKGVGSLGADCTWACWGSSVVSAPGVTADSGQPNAGSFGAPAYALISDLQSDGFRFDNPSTGVRLPALDLTAGAPVVRMDDQAAPVHVGVTDACAPSNGDPTGHLGSSGFVTSTAAGTGQAVRGCASAATGTIELFPTTFAPYGVVQLELTSSTVGCSVAGGVATDPTSTFTAVVRVHDPSLEPDGEHSPEAYQAVTLTSGQETDPLAELLTTDANVGGGHPLSDYIAAWSSPTGAPDQVMVGGQSGLDAGGALTVTTAPTRYTLVKDPTTEVVSTTTDVDASSAVALTLGALSCNARDER